jgi:NADPH:quinone reductase-like Zn-dependent oxidoreductase
MHDMWTPRGVGIKHNQFPMNLGCDGAGVLEDGREAVIHSIIGDPETLDPRRTLLTEQHQGTFADYVVIPPAPGGVASALIQLGRAASLRVGVTGRSEAKRELATKPGAHQTFEPRASLLDGRRRHRGKIVFPA